MQLNWGRMFSGAIFIILWPMSCPASYCLNSCNLNSTVSTAGQLDKRPDRNDRDAETEVWRTQEWGRRCSFLPNQEQRKEKVILKVSPFQNVFAVQNVIVWQFVRWPRSCSISFFLPPISPILLTQCSGAQWQTWRAATWWRWPAAGWRGRRTGRQNQNLRENPSQATTTTVSRSRWGETRSSRACPRSYWIRGPPPPLLFVQYLVNAWVGTPPTLIDYNLKYSPNSLWLTLWRWLAPCCPVLEMFVFVKIRWSTS